jgi:hypothetical protein
MSIDMFSIVTHVNHAFQLTCFQLSRTRPQMPRGYIIKSSHGTYCMQTQRKDLEVSIQLAQKRLQEGKNRSRHLRHEHQTLKHRVSAAQQSSPRPTPSRSPMQSTCFAESAIQPDQAGDIKAHFHAPAQPRRHSLTKQSQNMVHPQAVQGKRRSRHSKSCKEPSVKPISAFKHHAIVSFSALSKYITLPEFRSSQLNHQVLRQAFLMCQSETAQCLNVPASEICWLLEWPYEVCARRLCTSFSAWSGTCKLTYLVAETVLIIECMFLVMEHEHLSSAADPDYKPPQHPVLDAPAAPHPARPSPPDAAALAAASVRCNLKYFVQLEVALRQTLQPVIQKFRVLLPQRKWLAVCIQLMRISEMTDDVLCSMPDQNPEDASVHVTGGSPDQVSQCGHEV